MGATNLKCASEMLLNKKKTAQLDSLLYVLFVFFVDFCYGFFEHI